MTTSAVLYHGTEITEDAQANVQRRREGWLANGRAFVHPFEGLTNRVEPDKKAPAYTNPNKTDADIKSAQYAKLAGITGKSVLSRADYRTGKHAMGRMVSAQGKATRNVPVDLSGCVPGPRNVVCVSDGTDMTITGSEVRFLKRYRESMRGEAFAKAVAKEAAERELAFWRAANPWIPSDSHGRPWKGTSYKRQDGIGERIYADGSMLSERYAEWIEAQSKDMAALDRDAELAKLVAEQQDEARRERTKKVQMERDAVVMPLRF